MKKILLPVVIGVLLSGCAALKTTWESANQEKMTPEEAELSNLSMNLSMVQYVPLSAAPAQSNIQFKDVNIFTGTPPYPYVEVGMLSVQSNDSPEYLSKLLRLKASKIGCPAIMKFEVLDIQLQTKGTQFVNKKGILIQPNKDRHQNKVTGVAITRAAN